MRNSLFAASILLSLVTGCGAPQPQSPSQTQASRTKADFEEITAAFHETLRTNDLDRFMSYVADDVIFMPAGEAPVHGKSAMRTWMAAFLSQFRTSTLTLAHKEAFIGDGWAVEVGTYEWGLVPAAGGDVAIDHGSYMQVWKRLPDGQWRFAREVYNSSAPAAPPAAQ